MTRIYEGGGAERRLKELDLSREKLTVALNLAAGEARLCTRFDSPAQAAVTFWSRSNRFIREEYVPLRWGWSNVDSVLRTYHPENTFCVTAMSGAMGVGDATSTTVRARNPKGDVVRAVVERNVQLELAIPITTERAETRKVDPGIPTWFLLYSWDKDGIAWELSRPTGLTGNYVTIWSERIIPVRIPWDGEPLGFPSDVDPGSPDVDFEVRYTA